MLRVAQGARTTEVSRAQYKVLKTHPDPCFVTHFSHVAHGLLLCTPCLIGGALFLRWAFLQAICMGFSSCSVSSSWGHNNDAMRWWAKYEMCLTDDHKIIFLMTTFSKLLGIYAHDIPSLNPLNSRWERAILRQHSVSSSLQVDKNNGSRFSQNRLA